MKNTFYDKKILKFTSVHSSMVESLLSTQRARVRFPVCAFSISLKRLIENFTARNRFSELLEVRNKLDSRCVMQLYFSEGKIRPTAYLIVPMALWNPR